MKTIQVKTFKSVGQEVAERDFSRGTASKLAKRGIRLSGIQMIPGAGPMAWADATRAYVVDDNGTGRVLSFEAIVSASAK